MKRLLNEIKYWGQIFLIPIYGLSYLFPRSKNIWVCGSTFGRRFADNPKYFYLYLNQYQKEHVRAIWITKNKEVHQLLRDHNLESYYLYSIKGIWFSLRAKVYLYDNYSKDICFSLSGGATKINLWHGIPLKKIQQDNIFDKVRHPENWWKKIRWSLRRMSDEKPSDYVLTTSEFLRSIFASAFCTRNVLVCGYPRNDNLISERINNVLTEQEKQLINRIKYSKKENKIALYMPTFRDGEIKFFNVISTETFQNFLLREKILFLVKLHPKSKYKDRFLKIKENNIIIIGSEEDPYPILGLSDVLITDYSSIYFDFLLRDKPVIFFAYDLNEYRKHSREMYFEYDSITPGQKVYSQRELEEALRKVSKDEYRKERVAVCDRVFDNPNGFASQCLYSTVCDIINGKSIKKPAK